MFGKSRFLAAMVAGLALSLGSLAFGQEGEKHKSDPAPEDIKQDKPSFLVRADVNHANRSYREGDSLTITATCEVDAYLYVVYKQVDGKMYQIFPNSVQKDNRVKARQAVQVPAFNDMFRWQVSEPFGKETVTVLATKEPVDALSHPSMRSERFNPVSKAQLKGIELELGEEKPTDWAEDHVEITTYQGVESRATPNARRVGVFFGVSEYALHMCSMRMYGQRKFETLSPEEREKVGDKPLIPGMGLNLESAARDGRQMAETLQAVGQFDEVHLLTNDQVTRAGMEEMLTKKLPAITRPGDAVYIFYSGHCTQLPDDNGDEEDGFDECLVPHDFITVDLAQFSAKMQENKEELNQYQIGAANAAFEVLKKVGNAEQAKPIVLRNATISDDLFAHWMQRLAGRQLVVVLDTVYMTEPLDREDAVEGVKGPFDFATGEMKRLKSLGQTETALLAVCMPPRPFEIILNAKMSSMTGGLVTLLRDAKDSVTLEQAFEASKPLVAKYFERTNAFLQEKGRKLLAVQEPVLLNNCKHPVVFRP